MNYTDKDSLNEHRSLEDILNSFDATQGKAVGQGRKLIDVYNPICPKCGEQKSCRVFIYDTWGEPVICKACACSGTLTKYRRGDDIQWRKRAKKELKK